MNYICAECQAPFSAPPAWKKTCCTRACSDHRKKRLRQKPCAMCGQAFLPIRGRTDQQRFCSQKCDRTAKAAARRGYATPAATPVGAAWIELGDGEFTLVDADDMPMLSGHVWHKHKTGYATTKVEGKPVQLHQLLLPTLPRIDHQNRNTLDNRRSNLRSATVSQNGANRDRLSNNTSGYKGVTRYGAKWGARAGIRGARPFLGVFDTREQAAAAYDRAMVAGHGEFALPNGV